MRARRLIAAAALIVAPLPLFTQEIQVSRTQKAIDITVTDTTEVNPEIAVIRIGYRSYGATKDAALSENTQAATRITSAFTEAGLPGDAVETESVYIGEPQTSYEVQPRERKERQFESRQVWAIRVSVRMAQSVLDRVLQAGANDLEGVEWQVKDTNALETQADSAALTKARSLATQLAAKSQQKIGDLLYLSNTPGMQGTIYRHRMSSMAVLSATERPSIKLFPAKVRQEATVRVIFGLE